jgi:hypothetical protein
VRPNRYPPMAVGREQSLLKRPQCPIVPPVSSPTVETSVRWSPSSRPWVPRCARRRVVVSIAGPQPAAHIDLQRVLRLSRVSSAQNAFSRLPTTRSKNSMIAGVDVERWSTKPVGKKSVGGHHFWGLTKSPCWCCVAHSMFTAQKMFRPELASDTTQVVSVPWKWTHVGERTYYLPAQLARRCVIFTQFEVATRRERHQLLRHPRLRPQHCSSTSVLRNQEMVDSQRVPVCGRR